jgi:YYY domain-containing protein
MTEHTHDEFDEIPNAADAQFGPAGVPWSTLRKGLAILVAVVGIGGGLFWSAAYVNGVYRGEHTWITASRWIYENVPAGSVILWELWDDPLPKAVPGEPGMDMGTHGLRNIDWSPYEEDTAQKYEILKEKLREADYVAYSSKRIYDSVDELPRRYPMTTRYYDAMWNGSLGYELAYEITSPPRLFGHVFEDRTADESWSLYDHPQVTIFRKVRNLSDAEFDSVLGGTWKEAIPYDTGEPSRWTRPLMWLGLRGGPGSDYQGLFGTILGLVTGEHDSAGAAEDEPAQLLAESLAELPVVDNYRWNDWASASPIAAPVVWWLVLTLLGLAIWPICFRLFGGFRDRGYLLSRTAGWLLSGWLLWYLASFGVVQNTVRNAWFVAGAVAMVGVAVAYRSRHSMADYLRANWPILVAGEILSVLAFAAFILVRLANPDLWQPWFGGEKFMEFAFLNGILRSPTFPPVDPHFAGGFINYYYFGIYLAAYLIKLTGIHAEVAFNLTIAMLFALTVSNSFSIAYTAFGYAKERVASAQIPWRTGFAAALIAPLFVAVIGNLDGFAQVARNLTKVSENQATGMPPLFSWVPDALNGLAITLAGKAPFPSYDFWAPSRVIPFTINEFPYWSFLFADLHPHVIGIPLALLFCGLLFSILSSASTGWRSLLPRLIALGFLLGALSSVNLWELPTYLALGVLGLAVHRFRREGSAGLLNTAVASAIFAGVAVVTFFPFFRSYTNVGASGIGLVREPDPLGTWLLIWGLFLFVAVSWIVYALARRPWSCRGEVEPCTPTGVERAYSLAARQYDRLPRVIYLHRLLVHGPTFGYLVGLAIVPAGVLAAIFLVFTGHAVLALCVLLLAPALLLLWKRGADSDPAALLVAVLTFASLAILAGTQVIYLRDFLQGGDWYRMNTLFKFFMQVWVLLGLATSIAVPRMWIWLLHRARGVQQTDGEPATQSMWPRRMLAIGWGSVLVVLVVASLTFTVLGTPARLSQRMVGWRPPFGTLDGLQYMREGAYTLPDGAGQVDLRYDWEAIQWLLRHVRGNPVVVESSQVDYYRWGGTRVASMTGMSGLRGFHESEQRSGSAVSEREQLHREFWDTPDMARTEEIIDQLGIELIYVGPLERILQPGGVTKLEDMASEGLLQVIYENEGVSIYAVPGSLVVGDDDILVPAGAALRDSG